MLAAKRMIERSMERFDLYPARLMGDSAYGSAEMLGWLVYQHGIEPHVTVFDKSARTDGTFSRDDFTYDHASDVYVCPGGELLTTTGSLIVRLAVSFRASANSSDRWLTTRNVSNPINTAQAAVTNPRIPHVAMNWVELFSNFTRFDGVFGANMMVAALKSEIVRSKSSF